VIAKSLRTEVAPDALSRVPPAWLPHTLKTACRFSIGGLTALAFLQANAQEKEPVTFWQQLQAKGVYERLWEATRLYESTNNPVMQRLSLVGRYQGQFWSVNAQPGSASGWENRRFYAGAEAVLFHQFTCQVQMKFGETFDPVYDGLYQAFGKWSPSENFSLRAGRMDFLFAGLERTVSSGKIVTFERGQLSNQLWPGQVVGVTGSARTGDFSCHLGMFSGSIEQEFTTFAGGFAAVAGLGYELPLFYETGSLHLDYLFNNGNPANNALEPYDHSIALWHQGQSGPFGLGLELTWAHGLDARPAVFGVTILPTYVFAENLLRPGDALRAVVRGQFSISDGNNGLQLQPRYEQEIVPDGFGNQYQAIYIGIDYLLYGDRFKLMTGAEYSVMRDAANDGGAFAGWTYFSGVRVQF